MPGPPNVSNSPSVLYRSTLENLLRELLQASSLKITMLARIEGKIDQLKQEIQNVGTSLSAQLDAVTASIKADVAVVSAEVTALLAGLNPGDTITQTQIDALATIDTSLKAIPAAPTPAPAPTV